MIFSNDDGKDVNPGATDSPSLVKLASEPDAAYEVLYVTSPSRVLIKYDGACVAADKTGEGWVLSGTPCSPAETAFIEGQPGFGKTEVTVTRDG